MVSKLFLSGRTYSNRSEYDFLQVWFNIIDHNMSIKGVKVNIFFQYIFSLVFTLEVSDDGLIIPLVPQ